MARMHVGIVVHLEYLGRERPLEFASDTLCCRHGRSASTFVLMPCPARIPATGELAFSTPRRTSAGTAARTRGRRAVGLQANCRATILQHVDQARRHTELPPFVARQSGPRRCDHDGCAEPATNRAPRTRDDPEEFLWFCREHARVYNASWRSEEHTSELQSLMRISYDVFCLQQKK